MEVFDEIYKNHAWGGTGSRSGSGSELQKTKNIRIEIPKLINNYNIKTFFDCPCGDLTWISTIFDKIPNYVGGDICKDLIIMNQKQYNKKFMVFDLRYDKISNYDLLLVRDCLVHLSYNHIFQLLENIKKSDIKYFLTTNFSNRKNRDIVTGDWRPISLQEPPFNFPKPITTIKEDEIGIYADKHLCLYKKNDIP